MDKERSIKYDAEEDILEIFLTDNRESVAFELDNNLFIRVDPNTDEIVSVSMLGFRGHLENLHISAKFPRELYA